jgi:hypothetical protein
MKPLTTVFSAMILLAAPFGASADDDAVMDVCVKAFIAETLSKEQPVRIVTFDARERSPDARRGSYKILLTATGSTSGKQLAKGSCTVERDRAAIWISGKRMPISLVSTSPTSAGTTAAR